MSTDLDTNTNADNMDIPEEKQTQINADTTADATTHANMDTMFPIMSNSEDVLNKWTPGYKQVYIMNFPNPSFGLHLPPFSEFPKVDMEETRKKLIANILIVFGIIENYMNKKHAGFQIYFSFDLYKWVSEWACRQTSDQFDFPVLYTNTNLIILLGKTFHLSKKTLVGVMPYDCTEIPVKCTFLFGDQDLSITDDISMDTLTSEHIYPFIHPYITLDLMRAETDMTYLSNFINSSFDNTVIRDELDELKRDQKKLTNYIVQQRKYAKKLKKRNRKLSEINIGLTNKCCVLFHNSTDDMNSTPYPLKVADNTDAVQSFLLIMSVLFIFIGLRNIV